MMSVEVFVTRMLQLLKLERDAEIEANSILTAQLPAKELQRRGVCLLKLHLQERCTGLYGRTVATFQSSLLGSDLPAHRLTPGDIVGVSLMKEGAEPVATGVVLKVMSSAVQLAFEESQDVFALDDHAHYRLTRLANDVTYRRLKRALKDLNKYSAGPSLGLINVCFGLSGLHPSSVLQESMKLRCQSLTFVEFRKLFAKWLADPYDRDGDRGEDPVQCVLRK